ncbi:hypothetical protein PsYK624_149600 [Phanerochaete sordida]|uniref:Uncharacterized protein n=1 Tax=Phanerochaete sordida TaxID=48140 RepID=A0A9P3LKU9_9APHY|nr:hypothetical protein PsYK624_149600 [Phanerochaete sordida]
MTAWASLQTLARSWPLRNPRGLACCAVTLGVEPRSRVCLPRHSPELGWPDLLRAGDSMPGIASHGDHAYQQTAVR